MTPEERSELTAREIEILRLLADGLQGKEIAVRLGVAPKTVEFHKTRLYSRIGARRASDAVRFAIREGYLADG